MWVLSQDGLVLLDADMFEIQKYKNQWSIRCRSKLLGSYRSLNKAKLVYKSLIAVLNKKALHNALMVGYVFTMPKNSEVKNED